MRAKLLLQCTVVFSHTWTIVGFAVMQSTPKNGLMKRLSSFATPNDSLEDVKLNSAGNVVEKLLPYLPAADPRWMCIGPVGINSFVLCREGGPTEAELSNENILKIVTIECSDLEVNTLVWKCLGYRFDVQTEEWSASECFPKWREKYPTPPDLIGMQRMYVRRRLST
jgi:ammonia channel protein AmtB